MNRLEELASNRFCRICFTQDEGEIFSEILNTISQMELLSVGNIEIFDGDGFPDLICSRCKKILSNAYKFKQSCRKSDTQLKMYPMTGVIPPKINIPQEPLVEVNVSPPPLPPPKEVKSVETNTVETECKEASIQTDTIEDVPIEQMEMIITNDSEPLQTAIIAPPTLFEDVSEVQQFEIINASPPKKPENIKILNKSIGDKVPAKQFKKPAIKIEKVERIQPKILNSQLAPVVDETYIETIEESPDGNIQIINIYDNEEYLEEFDGKRENDKSEDGVVYTCTVCDRSFPLSQQLEIHKQNHERDRDHACEYCDKAFFTKYDLAKHILTHTKQKDYTCIVCKKSFSRSTLLYRHEKIHTDASIPRYKCEHCERVYLNKLDHDKHQATHSKKRPWACSYCDKKFAFKQGLERHEVIHNTSALPYPCEYCTDRFKTQAMLQRHLSAEHAGTRAFPCSKCSKRFMLSHHLYRHMRTAHQNEEDSLTLQCPDCEENFHSRESFIEHCMEHALETQICPMCKFSSESIQDITNHLDQHFKSDMYFCDYCACIYMDQEGLSDHLVEKHSNELCSIGEEEIEFIEPQKEAPKKRKQIPTTTVQSKKQKQIENLESASFIEYEEIETLKEEQKLPSVFKESLAKSLPTAKVSRVKMAPSEIERLKKEGKIIVQDGVLIMKS